MMSDPDHGRPPARPGRVAALLSGVPRPTGPDWVFACRTLLAGAAAYSLAVVLGLGHPPWAIMTVFIVAQPVAGMVLAKSAFRLLGTLLGALAGVLFATQLAGVPVVFALAIAVWVALCTAVAMSLRNPEAYGAALSGYTATIIALPTYGHSDQVMAIAQARVAEIVVGLACAALSSRLILPQLASDRLPARLRAAIRDLARYARDAFADADPRQQQAEFRRIITDIQTLAELRAYVRLESPSRSRAASVRYAISTLLQTLSSVRLIGAFAAADAAVFQPIRADLRAALSQLADDPGLLDRTPGPVLAQLQAVIDGTEAARLHVGAASDPVAQMARLTIGAEIARAFRSLIHSEGALAADAPVAGRAQVRPRLMIHRDHRAAVRGAIRAAAATLVFTGLWLWAGHPEFAGVVILIAVCTSLYPSAPDPLDSIRTFLKAAGLAVPLAFIAGQLVLPQTNGIGWLPVVTLPILLPTALAMANPRTARLGTSFAICFLALVAPAAGATYAPQHFMIAAASFLAGLLAAMAVYAAILPAHPARQVEALTAAMRQTLVRLCLDRRTPSRAAFEGLAYDRIARLIGPAGSVGPAGASAVAGAVASVTIGLQLIELRRLQMHAGALTPTAVGAVLQGLASVLGGLAKPELNDAMARLRALSDDLARSTATPDEATGALEAAAALRIIGTSVERHDGFFQPEGSRR